jgi:hypothetical protein
MVKLRKFFEEHLNTSIPANSTNQNHILSVPFTIMRSHKGAIVLKPDRTESDLLDLPPIQLRNLIRGIIWRDEHFSGTSMKEIAEREGMSKSGVQKIVMGSFDALMQL